MGPCDHSYFGCASIQRDFYLRPDGDSIQSNTEDGSLTRLDPLYPTHSSHSLGLKRIISGLNRKSHHSGKDSGQENGGAKGYRQRQSHDLFSDQGLENESAKNTIFGARGSRRRAQKPLNTNDSLKSSAIYATSKSDSVPYGDNSRDLWGNKCSGLAESELAAISRNLRSGSFNIPYRNGTPYGRPHELVKSTCNACRHMSISVNPPAQMHLKRLKARAESSANDGESQVLQLLQSHTRHVHFNQRRQLSEPGGLIRKRHSHYCEQEQSNSSFITRSPYPQSSPSMTDSRCFTNYALHPDTADMINRSLEQLHINHSGQITDAGALRSVPPRPVAEPSRQVPVKSSPITDAAELTLNRSAVGSCSPVVCSCPYHLDYPPCSLHEIPVPTVAHPAPQSPHPAAVHRTHCSVQPSPPCTMSGRLTEESVTDQCNHRRSTEIPDVNPYEVEKHEPPRSKSLTKSLSCYALKFFGSHHSYLRNRTGGKNDTSAFIQAKQKNRGKQGSIASSTSSTNNVFINSDTNTRIDKQHNVRVSAETEPNSEEQKTNANAFVNASTSLSVTGRGGGIVQTSNMARDGSIVWCDAHKKPGRPAPINCPNYLVKNVSNHSIQSDHAYITDPTPSNITSQCDLTVNRPDEPIRGVMFSSYSHYTYKPDLSDQWSKDEGSLPTAFSRLTHSEPRQQPILKAGTSELLRCLSFFVVARLQLGGLNPSKDVRAQNRLRCLSPSVIVGWIKAIDRALLLQGWSELAFINPPHVVFLFMLLKECLDYNISSERELHTVVMACLYLSYSYMGNEISYPLKPFLVAETNQLLIQNGEVNRKLLEGEGALMNGYESSLRTKVIDQVRNRFWQYCLRIINSKSSEMLQINANPVRFTELFAELRSYESLVVPLNMPMRVINTPK
ncbi:Cyclin-dependent kinase 5 activator 1 [Fasciola hepatica]|uniref:Cyclin-dependent kinase 5 activator 1 n=1 Tax=Fasciola hepatica TaxID=6192 RepID=A0A4E0R747_FASHE|nr:Cyclin-dependent kinase 5 activator 1 [Fasciola hepatica]